MFLPSRAPTKRLRKVQDLIYASSSNLSGLLTIPTAARGGDLAVVFSRVDETGIAGSDLAGWTLEYANPTSGWGYEVRTFSKLLTASDPGTTLDFRSSSDYSRQAMVIVRTDGNIGSYTRIDRAEQTTNDTIDSPTVHWTTAAGAENGDYAQTCAVAIAFGSTTFALPVLTGNTTLPAYEQNDFATEYVKSVVWKWDEGETPTSVTYDQTDNGSGHTVHMLAYGLDPE